MRTLRDLPDLELAALGAGLHESFLFFATLSFSLTKYAAEAVREIGKETITRRAGDAGPERLFPDDRLDVNEFSALRDLMFHLIAKLRENGFPAAAELLEERLATEVRADVSAIRDLDGIERRELH